MLEAVPATEWTELYGTGDRECFLKHIKSFLARNIEKLKTAHAGGASGVEIVLAYSVFMDSMITELFKICYCPTGSDKGKKWALVAVGGFGRKELSPYSDIDLLFLHSGEANDAFSRSVKETLYFLWDTGFDVGYSYRTARECYGMAASDTTVLTSLLEARFLYGSKNAFDSLVDHLFKKVVAKGIDSFIKDRLKQKEDRYKKYENSINLLEPNVKESPGGLRDYHLALWLGRAKLKINTLDELCVKRLINHMELDSLQNGVDFLLRVRNELHFLSGRRSDVLVMEKQKDVAANLGFVDVKGKLAVEEFMRQYYLHSHHIYYTSQRILNRYAENSFIKFFKKKRRVAGFGELSRCDDKLYLGNASVVPEKIILKIFKLCQDRGLTPSDELKADIRAGLFALGEDFRTSQENVDTFLSIISGSFLYRILSIMHELRVLDCFIPEFEPMIGHMQFDFYHMFTVDEHVLLGFKHLEGLESTDEASLKLLSQVYKVWGRADDLRLAFFLHDLGKGQGGGHSERSVDIATKVLDRWRISGEKRESVLFLVGKHLLMSHVAQRSNLHDEEVIATFAAEVGSLERLEKLFLLTYIDIRSVGNDVWNSWKAMLLDELFMKTSSFILKRHDSEPENKKAVVLSMLKERAHLLKNYLDEMPDDYIKSAQPYRVCRHLELIYSLGEKSVSILAVRNRSVGYTDLMVCTVDKSGVLASITGLLASMGLNILGAQVYTQDNNVVVNTIQVDEEVDEHAFEGKLSRLLSGETRLSELFKNRKRYFARSKKVIRVPAIVNVDNSVSQKYTKIEVCAEDKVGLLYAITHTLSGMGFSIHTAKICTEGNKAIDTFDITTNKGLKIYDTGDIARLQKNIIREVENGE